MGPSPRRPQPRAPGPRSRPAACTGGLRFGRVACWSKLPRPWRVHTGQRHCGCQATGPPHWGL